LNIKIRWYWTFAC